MLPANPSKVLAKHALDKTRVAIGPGPKSKPADKAGRCRLTL